VEAVRCAAEAQHVRCDRRPLEESETWGCGVGAGFVSSGGLLAIVVVVVGVIAWLIFRKPTYGDLPRDAMAMRGKARSDKARGLEDITGRDNEPYADSDDECGDRR
jgi:hypothetical protein